MLPQYSFNRIHCFFKLIPLEFTLPQYNHCPSMCLKLWNFNKTEVFRNLLHYTEIYYKLYL